MSFDFRGEGCVQEFFHTVQEQIRYKPAREMACRELEDHLEDKTEEYIKAGMEERVAAVQAVKEMGDAVALGVKLNESYSLQNNRWLFGGILLAVSGGVISNFVYGYRDVSYSAYFLLGIAVLLAVTVYGYRFCAAHGKALTAATVFYGAVCGAYGICQGILKIKNQPSLETLIWKWRTAQGSVLVDEIMRKLLSMPVQMGGLLLAVPLCAFILFKGKYKKDSGLVASGVLMLAAVMPAGLGQSGLRYFLPAIVIVLVSYVSLSVAAVGIGKKILIPVLAALLGIAFIAVCGGGELKAEAELFLTPQKQATSRWNDGYNGVMIKELLGRAKLVGSVELTQEEWTDYGTGDWYFKNGEDENFMKHFRPSDPPKTEDILPQHYLNNYRISYVIIKYGWAAGIVFLAGLAGMAGLLFYTTFRIKNRFGFLLAFGSSVALTMQTVFYVLGNFGHQFGMFTSLPFLSEGIISIVVNMTLAGLVLSAYRYDRVADAMLLWEKSRQHSIRME